jgi:hypothetical protein
LAARFPHDIVVDVMAVADIKGDIAAYEAMQNELETDHQSQWVLFHDRQLISIHDSFEQAAEEAIQKFGRGPYLIRQIGAPPMVLPASVIYNLI